MEHLVLATYPITNSCNISCPWCAAHLSSQPLFNTAHVLGALLRAQETYGPLHGVALTGGEPFTSPRILEVKGALEAAGYRVFAITNGTLHDKIWEFQTGDTLDIAMSVHSMRLFPDDVVAKKQALLEACRDRKVKMVAALFSVDSLAEVADALEFIEANRDVFHSATLSTVYRKGVPSMSMEDLMTTVFDCRLECRALYVTPGKVVMDLPEFPLVLRRSPTREEYNESHNIPGCLFMSWRGEFLPVAQAQYENEEALA